MFTKVLAIAYFYSRTREIRMRSKLSESEIQTNIYLLPNLIRVQKQPEKCVTPELRTNLFR